MARPRKGQEMKATTQIGVRVTPGIRERLEALAARNGRSITEEIRAALEAHVGGSGLAASAVAVPVAKKRRAKAAAVAA